MPASDFLSNPFAATFNAVSGASRRGEKESRQAARDEWAVQSRDWLSGQDHGRSTDTMRTQHSQEMAAAGAQHSRSMEFMQAQHTNTASMEQLRGSESRLNMRHAQKSGLTSYSQKSGADGSYETSFNLKPVAHALVEQTATKPPAGQAVIPVGDLAAPVSAPVSAPEKPAAAASKPAPSAAPAGAPAAPKAAPKAAQKAPAGRALGAGIGEISARLNTDSGSGAQVSDEKPGMAPPAHSGKASKGARQHKLF